MGSFYCSLSARADCQEDVLAALRFLQPETNCYVGPAVRGWVTLYPSEHEKGQVLSKSLSRQLESLVFWFLVHDSDVFLYELHHAGNLLDQFKTGPSGDSGGDPSKWIGRLPSAPSASVLSSVLVEHAAFKEDILQNFAEKLGIVYAVGSYDYFRRGDIPNQQGFIHLESAGHEEERLSQQDRGAHEQRRLRALLDDGVLSAFAELPEARDPQSAWLKLLGFIDYRLLFLFTRDWKTPRLYSIETGTKPRTLMDLPIPYNSVITARSLVAPDGCVWVHYSSSLITLDPHTRKVIAQMQVPERGELVGNPPVAIIAHDQRAGLLRFHDLRDGLGRPPIPVDKDSSFAVSPNASMVAIATWSSSEGAVRFFEWNNNLRELKTRFELPHGSQGHACKRIVFSPSGTWVAIAHQIGLSLLSIESALRQDLDWIPDEDGLMESVIAIADSASGIRHGRSSLERLSSENFEIVAAPLRRASVPSWNPRGDAIAAGCGDGVVRIWRAPSWTLEYEFRDFAGMIVDVRFNSTNKMIASSNGRRTVKIWRMD